MVFHLLQPCRSRSSSPLVLGQSLIWGAVMIASALLLHDTNDGWMMLIILLTSSSASVALTAAACRRSRSQADGDGGPGA